MWWSKGKLRAARQASEGVKASASPMIMFLEPRMLFDGAVAATVAEAAQPESHPTAEAAKPTASDHAGANPGTDAHPQADAVTAPSPSAVPGETVVFVDSRVKDFSELLKGVAPGTQVVMLDASKDGLQQIADYLDTHQGVSSVQIIAHGNSGDLWLGNTYLSADNVAARSEVLADIGKDMNVGGDILIYACYTAEGEKGVSFVDSLAELTGRDVAASTNRTGVGGDWALEIATGSIESVSAFSQQAMDSYQWGLASYSVTNNSDAVIAGSLRTALNSAQNGDLILFNSTMTVSLNSTLVISKNVTIDGDWNNDGVADVTLDGQYKSRVVEVTTGSTVTLDGLIITKGLVAGDGADNGNAGTLASGGGIFNAGVLTLKNVQVIANVATGGGGGGGVVYNGSAGGAGGGGSGVGGGLGGDGGDAHSYGSLAGPTILPGDFGSNGTANTGGVGGGDTTMGGKGGTTSGGGAGGVGTDGYSTGGAGATATAGGLTVGGGGGGAGYDAIGGAGGSAVGGIYNAGTLNIIGTTTLSNNIGVGGGGGGGNGVDVSTLAGGDGGKGVGAIWNAGTVNITGAAFTALATAGNVGASGAGGKTYQGAASSSPAGVSAIYTDLNTNSAAVVNSNYVPDETPPTVASLVVVSAALNSGATSTVNIVFSETVTGFTLGKMTATNGTLSNLATSDGGKTWTATLTAASNIEDATNVISLDLSGVQDAAGNTAAGTVTSNNYAVHDTVPATATIVVADNTLKMGETSAVTITFSEPVTGFDLTDINTANGTLSNLTSNDGGTTWTATLTPTANISDTSNVISLNNAGVQDANGNAGVGVSTSNNYAIDGVRPTATIVVANPSLGIGGSSLVTITFSEAVTGFTNTDLMIANGALTAVSSSDGGVTWTATFTPFANTTDTTNVISLDNTGIQDATGNTGVGITTSNNYVIDTQRPTANIVLADPTLTAGETSLVTITFSEAVSGFTNADLTIANGTLTAVSSSDGGITWTATFTPTTAVNDATNVISLVNASVADLAGNTNSGVTNSANYTINTVRPTATISFGDNALKIGDTSTVTITFSEAVSGFTNTDLTIANGTLTTVSSSDGGVTWTATFTPTNSISDTTNVISLDNSGVQAASSGNAGSGTTDSGNYTVDTQRPTVTIVVADANLGVGQTSLVTFTFSEAVTGFTTADLTIDNATLTALSSSDGGITWTATLTPDAGVSQSNNHITIDNTGYSDVSGNTGTGDTNSNAYTIDSQPPTSTITLGDSTLTAGETSLVTITFSEAVTGFTNADLTVPNGTLSAVSSSDGGLTWTATFTPTSNVADTTNVITLANTGVTDVAGNVGVGTTNSPNFTIDNVRPTATVVVTDGALKAGETSLVTITFSQAVTGFTNADLDLTAANGTLSAVSSSDGGVTWTATFTPTTNITDTSNLISLDSSGVQTASGNTGLGTTASNNYTIDTARPTATIVVGNSNMGIGGTSTVTITFSEAVSGFDLSDLSVPNGNLSNLVSSDGGMTWTATLTPTAGITDGTNLIVLDNSNVSDTAGNSGSGIAISNNYSVDADRPTATIVIANPNLLAGQTSLVTFTFTEKVTQFELSDLSVANGVLSNLSSSDGGKTWTATLTPTANLVDPSNFITLDNSNVTDLAGNSGTGFANSNNYAITTVSTSGDPEFRASDPVTLPDLPNVPLQPQIFGPPTGDLGSPLVLPPLFEVRDSGGGLPPIGNIFINNGALAPSFIAQVFSSESGSGDGNGSGFLGFGGGDGGVFGSSTLSSIFSQSSDSDSSLNAFDNKQIKGQGDLSGGLKGVFGAPTLGQQLYELKEIEQRQLHALSKALQEVGISEMQA